eukprot:4862319-Prymnesium_polylepis.1
MSTPPRICSLSACGAAAAWSEDAHVWTRSAGSIRRSRTQRRGSTRRSVASSVMRLGTWSAAAPRSVRSTARSHLVLEHCPVPRVAWRAVGEHPHAHIRFGAVRSVESAWMQRGVRVSLMNSSAAAAC